MEVTKIKITALEGAVLPSYMLDGDAGMDVCSYEDGEIAPRSFKTFRTGISIELPTHLEAQVRPRSGLASKNGITVLNSPGTVDSGYRGEIKVVLMNHSDIPYKVSIGDRIAQIVIAEYTRVSWIEVDALSSTQRDKSGFGSTFK